MEDLLTLIEQEDLTSTQKGETYETLFKVLKNIRQNPAEQKFRCLKKDNKLVSEKLCRSSGAVSVLLALGFEDDGSMYRCPPSASVELIGEVVDLLECIVASREAEVDSAPASSAAAAPDRPTAAAATAAQPARLPQGFARRSDEEQKRERHARELEAARAAQRAQFAGGGGAPAALRATAPESSPAASPTSGSSSSEVNPDGKKPIKTAFDFESRAKRDQQKQTADQSLEELRRQQREKFKQFEADPNARNGEAYQKPASVAPGGKVNQGWGDWFGSMFSGSSGSSGGGGGGGGGNNDDRKGPRMKTIKDLPKPVQRG